MIKIDDEAERETFENVQMFQIYYWSLFLWSKLEKHFMHLPLLIYEVFIAVQYFRCHEKYPMTLASKQPEFPFMELIFTKFSRV